MYHKNTVLVNDVLNSLIFKNGLTVASRHWAVNRAMCSTVFSVSSSVNLSNFGIFQLSGIGSPYRYEQDTET